MLTSEDNDIANQSVDTPFFISEKNRMTNQLASLARFYFDAFWRVNIGMYIVNINNSIYICVCACVCVCVCVYVYVYVRMCMYVYLYIYVYIYIYIYIIASLFPSHNIYSALLQRIEHCSTRKSICRLPIYIYIS